MKSLTFPNSLFIGSLLVLSFNYSDPALAQKVCVETDTGKIECGRLVNNPKSNPPKSMQIEDNDFNFELQNCQRNGNNLRCNLLITNKADIDRKFWLSSTYSPGSRIISTSGEEVAAKTVQLGQKQGSSWVELQLIRSVPLKAIVNFENVPRQVSSLSVLEVGYGFYNPSTTGRTIQFRNVAIESK